MSDRYPENDSGQDIPEPYGWLAWMGFGVVVAICVVVVMWLAQR